MSSTSRTTTESIDRAIEIMRSKLLSGQEEAFCHQRFRGAGDRCLECRLPRKAHDFLEVIDVLRSCRRS